MSSVRERNLDLAYSRERRANVSLEWSLRAAESREALLREALAKAEEKIQRLDSKNTQLNDLLFDQPDMEDQIDRLRADLESAETQATRLAKRNADLEEQVRNAERLLVQHRWAAKNTPEDDTDG